MDGIPTLICVVIFFWSASLYVRNARPPDASTEIFVIGKQWMWHLQHPEGVREINELHVPVGVPIKLTMTSQDVIHDFYIPAFRVKKDVLPGRYTSLWFQATKTGHIPPFLRPVLRHRPRGNDRLGLRDVASRLRGVAFRRRIARIHGAGRRKAVQPTRLRDVPLRGQYRARAIARWNLREAGKTAQRRNAGCG